MIWLPCVSWVIFATIKRDEKILDVTILQFPITKHDWTSETLHGKASLKLKV